jgi:hypothetical protein
MLLGGLVTTCFGFSLCAYIVDRIGGGPPSLNLFDFMVVWFIFGALPFAAGTLLLRTAPFAKRFWKWVLISVSFLLLVVGGDIGFGPKSWYHLFRHEKFPGTDAAALKRTVVTPVLETEITRGTNLLWCGTFQLAWNEACHLVGGDLQLEKSNALVSALNQHSFTKESLDEASYIAVAGFLKDDIRENIRRAVQEKFHGVFNPRFIPQKRVTERPQDFIAYACLYKNLSFPTPFERLDDSLMFEGVPVPAFGIGEYKTALDAIYPQVSILDYRSEDDFVIELKTKSPNDRLILAKLQPNLTLAETIMSVSNRIAEGPAEAASTNDLLLVPRMKLDLTREYTELEGLHLIPRDPKVAKDLNILGAVQNTFFVMNEKGVELRSEAHLEFGCAKQEEPVPKHRMIFNKAFLILMQQRDAKMPYFVFWVDNPEVLTTWK